MRAGFELWLFCATWICTSSSCAAPCAVGRSCGTATWVPQAVDEPIVEGSASIFRATHARVSGESGFADREAIELRRAPAFFTFELSELVQRGLTVERATLVFSPHPRWQTSQHHRQLAVHALATLAAADATTEPILADNAATTAVVTQALRAPIRLDVTTIAREWLDGARPAGGLAVSADAEGIVIQGASAVERDDRPRLELVVR